MAGEGEEIMTDTTAMDKAAAAARALVRTRVRAMGQGLIADTVLRVRYGSGATAPDPEGYVSRVADSTHGAHRLAASCREIAAEYAAAASALLAVADGQEGGRIDPARLLREVFGGDHVSPVIDREEYLAAEAICEAIASPHLSYMVGLRPTPLSSALAVRAALDADPADSRRWRVLSILAEIPSLVSQTEEG
jgi:hypothetical protein